jgi:alpha-L-rhamnosidase
MAGWPLLKLPKLPAGTTIKVAPAESLNANGTVDQASLGPASGSRGRDLFHTYTTAGRDGGETWHPAFNYFGMQWVQVTGLPSDFKPSEDLVTGLRLQVDAPIAGTFTSSNARINRIAKMARYSFASNMMSVFTDCPGREKLSYPADYISAVGAIYRNFHIDAYLRNTMHHLVDGQSIANTSMRGNVPLKAPVYDVGYSGRFGDEINWGNSIVLVPSLLHDMYGDTSIMTAHYDQMVLFIEYIQRQKAQGHIVDAALGDWIEATGQSTSGRITGKWGYYLAIRAMARMANITGHSADADRYTTLAGDIRDAFNAAFWSDSAGRYTNTGNNGTSNATQAAQALALDAGLVPDGRRKQVTDALVELVQGFPAGNRGPHLGGGTIGMGPIVRALAGAGRHDVLWQALEANDQPSYGYFLAQTAANPNGFTTIGEQWDRGSSKNHMILAQIDEWFHAGIAGIRPTSFNTLTSTWEDGLTFQPQLVGDLESAAGTYQTRRGEARSEWKKTEGGQFTLKVTVPANTKAEVRVPSVKSVNASARAKLVGQDDSYTIYSVPSGNHSFKAKVTA